MASSSSSAVKFALVGCGAIARHHLKGLLSSSHPAIVAALVDTRKNNAEELLGLLPKEQASKCQVFGNISDLLSWDKFDAAVLMVPHNVHQPYATSCLRANKHVLLEKPLAHTLESAVTLLEDVSKTTNRVCMVGEQSPYWPEVMKASDLLKEGTIGKPFHAMANYWEAIGYSTFLDRENFFTNWRFDPVTAGGGILMDGMTHWTRPLTLWFGDVQEAVGVVGYPLAASKCESQAHAILRFTSGHTATLYGHFNSIPMKPRPFFHIFGDQGEITIDGSFDGGMSYQTCSIPDGVELPSLGGFSAAFTPQMEVFMRKVVQGDTGCTESAEKAMKDVLLAHAVYKSFRTKQWEELTLENLLPQ